MPAKRRTSKEAEKSGNGSQSPNGHFPKYKSGLASPTNSDRRAAKGPARANGAKNGLLVDEESHVSGDAVKLVALSQPVEDFLSSGLLPNVSVTAGGKGILQVSSEDAIGLVVEKILQYRMRSCIVEFSDGRMEFFDCTDLNWILLETLTGNGVVSIDEVAEDWSVTKEQLRRVANAPVREALRAPRGPRAFQRFDAHDSFDRLLMLLRTRNRVPVFRDGQLVRIVTAMDILEMFCCASEESKLSLERMRISDLLKSGKSRGLCDVQVNEDCTTLEVLYKLRKADAHVAPVAESFIRSINLADMRGLSEMSSEAPVRLVGQFEVGALRMMFVRSQKDDSDTWWWEDASVTSSFLHDPCMDFLAHIPKLMVSSQANVPFQTVTSEESLARTISRTLASDNRSVVVTQASDAAGGPSAVKGALTAYGLVDLMLEAGFLRDVRFDALLAKAASQTPGVKRPSRMRSSTRVLETPPALTEPRKTKVRFSDVVELDQLQVPVCLDHGSHFMKYVTIEGTIMFHGLMDFLADERLVDANAQCHVCGSSMGRIALRRPSQTPTFVTAKSEHSNGNAGAGLFGDLPSFGVLTLEKSGRTTPKTIKDNNPSPASCLKNARMRSQSTSTDEVPPSQHCAGGSMFLGFCCAPCTSGSKDRIVPGESHRARPNKKATSRVA